MKSPSLHLHGAEFTVKNDNGRSFRTYERLWVNSPSEGVALIEAKYEGCKITFHTRPKRVKTK